ncbi:diacylglycerol/polyprenol kinase family protein [Dehalococcoides mccartyi]|uniref:diacylglycerol/polyprenol kinase family protein n=2 Tax=Dehalococcoidaceae TaxID=1202464 RepID=UPI003393EA81
MLNNKFARRLCETGNRVKVPSTLWRRLWHLVGGSFFPILAFFIQREGLLITIGVITGIFVAWEVARFVSSRINRWSVSHLRMILKREERFQPTGTTLLLLASFFVFLLFDKYIAITASLFVAVGDPIAAIVGSRFGKHMLSEKTVEGSMACLASCLIIGMLMTRVSSTLTLPTVAYGAICATVTEMLPIPADDNFTMPLSSAVVMALIAFYSV